MMAPVDVLVKYLANVTSKITIITVSAGGTVCLCEDPLIKLTLASAGPQAGRFLRETLFSV